MATTARPRRRLAAEHPADTPASTAEAPAAKKAAPRKTAVAKTSAAKAPAAKKAAAKRAPPPATAEVPAKKASAKRTSAKKAEAETPAAKTAAAKPAAAKKTAARKPKAEPPAAKTQEAKTATASEKPPAKKKGVAAKTPAKKAPANKAATKKPTRRQPARVADGSPATVQAPDEAPARTLPAAPAPRMPKAPPPPVYSALRHVRQDELARLLWQPGSACPAALADAAAARTDAEGWLAADDDEALPELLRLAAAAGHRIELDEAAWRLLAAQRDARRRLQVLESAYPEGPASPALQSLLHTTLSAFQAEGALFAVVAGRALIADERGLGKRVQAIAATLLWRRHFGVQRVLVLCTPAQRVAWQQAFLQFAGAALGSVPQLLEGTLHQRQSLWSAEAELRILSPDTLESDAAHIAHWAPELVIVDEPQQLPGWQSLAAPQALVLCGAPLADPPALLQAIVGWLDQERQGALHALLRIQAAREQNLALSDEDIETLDDALSRVMLQRLRSEVEEQLPPRIFSARLVPLAPPQREAQDRLRQQVQRLLAGWQRCGYLSDADQWQLAAVLRALPDACHRSEPGNAGSPLAEASIAALQAQLDDWRATGTQRIALACASPADQVLLAQRLPQEPPLHWLAPGEAPPPQTEVVLQIGVPWCPPPVQAGAPAGQQWVFLAGQDSLEQGLARGLAARQAVPAGPGSDSGFLQGSALGAWLDAWRQALQP